MTVKRIVEEAINESPLGLKEALEEELRNRIFLALEAKMEDDDEDDEEDEEDDDEKLDEISQETLKSYMKRASHSSGGSENALDKLKAKARANKVLGNDAEANRYANKAKQRDLGISRAIARAGARETGTKVPVKGSEYEKRLKSVPASYFKKESFDLSDYTVEELEDFMMSEDFEQLDEISKKKLASYVHRAVSDVRNYGAARGRGREDADTIRKAKNREAGVRLATDKIVGDTTWDYHKSGKKSDEYTMKPNEKQAALRAKRDPATVLNKKQ